MANDITIEFLRHCLRSEKFKDEKIDDMFSNIKNLNFMSFKNFDFEKLELINTQKNRLKQIQDDIDIEKDLRATIIKYFAKSFIRRQLKNISEFEY